MKTTVLMILDGFGINDRTEGNAIKLAKTPVIDSLMKEYPCVKGYASGLDMKRYLLNLEKETLLKQKKK